MFVLDMLDSLTSTQRYGFALSISGNLATMPKGIAIWQSCQPISLIKGNGATALLKLLVRTMLPDDMFLEGDVCRKECTHFYWNGLYSTHQAVCRNIFDVFV